QADNPGFSTRQVEGLQRVDVLQRKLAFQFPHLFIKSVLGSGAWRFQRDLGGMKSSILGPGFGNGQGTDCTGGCRAFCRGLTYGSELRRAHPGREGVRRAPPGQTGVRRAPPRQAGG
ncbi:unnamed protein product, partial [Staurois parvus]